MLECLRAPFMVLHISYYTLMTLLRVLSVVLLSMMTLLLCALSVIRDLIFGGNYNWLLNFNLICRTLWSVVASNLLISLQEKLSWFCLIGLKQWLY